MMLAGRNAMMMRGGASTPTARDYVQSGLVAMWDGIENAGWGTHDAAATTWADLSGNGYDLVITALTSVAYWADNGFVFNKRSLGGNEYFWHRTNTDLQTRLGQTLTFELVINIDSASLRNYSSFNGACGNYVNGFYSQMSVARNACEIGTTTVSSTSGQSGLISVAPSAVYGAHHLAYKCDTTGSTLLIDSANAGTGGAINQLQQTEVCIGSSFDQNGDGRNPSASSYYRTPVATYFRVALYSRNLTDAEVAANYAVDAARFGL
jgi:hypothetical protein